MTKDELRKIYQEYKLNPTEFNGEMFLEAAEKYKALPPIEKITEGRPIGDLDLSFIKTGEVWSDIKKLYKGKIHKDIPSGEELVDKVGMPLLLGLPRAIGGGMKAAAETPAYPLSGLGGWGMPNIPEIVKGAVHSAFAPVLPGHKPVELLEGGEALHTRMPWATPEGPLTPEQTRERGPEYHRAAKDYRESPITQTAMAIAEGVLPGGAGTKLGLKGLGLGADALETASRYRKARKAKEAQDLLPPHERGLIGAREAQPPTPVPDAQPGIPRVITNEVTEVPALPGGQAVDPIVRDIGKLELEAMEGIMPKPPIPGPVPHIPGEVIVTPPPTIDPPKLLAAGKIISDQDETARIIAERANAVSHEKIMGMTKMHGGPDLTSSAQELNKLIIAGGRKLKDAGVPLLGEIAEKTGAKKLWDEVGDPFIGERLRRAFIPFYRSPKELVEYYEKDYLSGLGHRKSKIQDLMRKVENEIQTPEQKAYSFMLLKGDDYKPISGELEIISRLSPMQKAHVEKMMKPVRDYLDELADEITPYLPEKLQQVVQKNKGIYLPRLYEHFEGGANGAFRDLLDGSLPLKRQGQARFMSRKDIEEAMRLRWGEIREGGYPAQKAMFQIGQEVEVNKMFGFIRANEKWVREIPEEGFTLLKGSPQDYGAIANTYIRDDVYKTIKDLGNVIGREKYDKGILKHWVRGTSVWKKFKTAYNPSTHFRNIYSNFIFNDLGGMSLFDKQSWKSYQIALRELRNGYANKGSAKYFKEAQELGLFQGYYGNEVKMLERAFNSSLKKKSPIQKAMAMVEELGDKAGTLYNAEEEWAKLAKFIHNRTAKGMDVAEAVKDARYWTIDWSKSTRTVRDIGRFYSPFFAFTYHSIPILMRAAKTNPVGLLKWGALATMGQHVVNPLVYNSFYPDHAQQDVMGADPQRAVLPDYMKSKLDIIDIAFPDFLKMPFMDAKGQSLYLDLSYIMPWGDIGEVGNTGFFREVGLPKTLQPSHPLFSIASAMVSKKDPYFGTDIKTKGQMLGYMYNQFTPGVLSGYFLPKIIRSIKSENQFVKGAQSMLGLEPSEKYFTFPGAVASAVLGLKLKPVETREEFRKRIREFKRKEIEFKKNIKYAKRSVRKGYIGSSAAQGDIDEYKRGLAELKRERREFRLTVKKLYPEGLPKTQKVNIRP